MEIRLEAERVDAVRQGSLLQLAPRVAHPAQPVQQLVHGDHLSALLTLLQNKHNAVTLPQTGRF